MSTFLDGMGSLLPLCFRVFVCKSSHAKTRRHEEKRMKMTDNIPVLRHDGFDDVLERIATDVVDASVKLHKRLGPGLLESVYEAILARELERRGHRVERQKPIPIRYEDLQFDEGFRADLVVDGCFIVELKSVESLVPVHVSNF